jgi:hypothetical protein
MKHALLLACAVLATACAASERPPESDDGGAGGARAGGTGGAQAGGSGGSMMTRPAPGELDGAYLQLDCASEEIEFQFCHPKDKGNREIPLAFGGEPGKTYSVVLGVWAVTETVTYTGGTRGGDHYYIGGKSSTPATAEYGLRVGKQTYFLNHQDTSAGEHYTFGYTYVTPPMEIPGGATLTLYVSNPQEPDDLINTNHMQSEAENPPPRLQQKLQVIHSAPLEGQYVYIEVQSTKLVP